METGDRGVSIRGASGDSRVDVREDLNGIGKKDQG